MFACPLLVGVLLGTPSELTIVYGEASFVSPVNEDSLVDFFKSKGISIDPRSVDTVKVPRTRCTALSAVAEG